MSDPVALGVDAGSTTWKAVAIDAGGNILGRIVEPADPLIEAQTEEGLKKLGRISGAPADLPVGATGYGRKRVRAARVLTEITCHAMGAYHCMKGPGTLIDIGGQDTKVIRIGPKGEVTDFAMNDKCAAGTGRFLEVILGRLKVPLDDVARRVSSAGRAVPVSSTCTVFAESEVVSLVAQGRDVNEIIRGLHLSLAFRISALAGRISRDTKLYMSGGVALNPAMVKALSDDIGVAVTVLKDPQLVGALGAALSVKE